MTKKSRDGAAVIAAIVGIVIMVCFALYLGFDGAILTLGVAAVAGLGGIKLAHYIKD